MTEKRKKIGLALGGGFARGLSHIGVLEVLEREGIPIDVIAGTSIGSVVGALYARETNAALVKKQALSLDWRRVASLVDPIFAKGGLLGGRRVIKLLERFIGNVQFNELAIPLSCVATDLITGEEVILNQGSVTEAVRASISIPMIFSVVKRNGRFLVDGGLVNQVPVSIAKKMGADFVIAVDITPTRTERANYLAKHKEDKEPGILQVILQTVYLATYRYGEMTTAGADVVIHPSLAHIGAGEFYRARECILEGELAAVDSISKIKHSLAAASS
ncbi:MAG: patatin-like phospholipase family protein [Dehalococcoidales bacterium]|nr:patatin-like phospholipase family protein [Dehalococcoidales bacterium]